MTASLEDFFKVFTEFVINFLNMNYSLPKILKLAICSHNNTHAQFITPAGIDRSELIYFND